MFPSKFLQFPSILTHFHAANEKIQNGGRDLAISRGLVWVNTQCARFARIAMWEHHTRMFAFDYKPRAIQPPSYIDVC